MENVHFAQKGISRKADTMILRVQAQWLDESLWFRPFEASDVGPEYLSTLNDSEYMKFSQQKFIKHTAETAHAYVSSIRRAGGDLIACLDCETESLVSTVSVRCGALENEVWLGLMTLRCHAGKGVGLKAWLAVARRLCESDGTVLIRAGTHVDNAAMQRIMSRSGFLVVAPTRRTSNQMYFIRKCTNRAGGADQGE